MTPIFTNNAVGTLAASYTPDATALTLSGGQGDKFPSPLAGEFFPVTVVNPANEIEVVWCTAKTGDTLTVVRGQEGTTARALAAGEKAEHRLTAGAINSISSAPLTAARFPTAPGIITGAMIAAGAITTGKIANGAVGGNQLFQGRFIHESFLDIGAAAANLGFTPVKQMGAYVVSLEWLNATTKLQLAIDGAVKGNVLYEVHDGTVNSGGYRALPTNVQNSDYTFGFVDNGRQVLHTAGNNVYSIPTDAAVHILIGGLIKVVNRGGSVVISPPAGVVLRWLPSNAVGARTLAAPGTCVLEKMDGTEWWVYGMGLS
jgi:hypothetical protein